MAADIFYVIYVSNRDDVRFDEVEPILLSATGQGGIERIIIRAHTDGIGTAPDNLALSQRWANDLKNWMVARGVAPDLIEAEGFGESQPLEAVPDEMTSVLNQRIEIEFRFGG